MSRKSLLGIGLKDLLNENTIYDENESIVEIDIEKLKANPDQPRKTFNKEALQNLSNSIKQHGILQPILVKKINETFFIVAGERRYRAAKMANLKVIPAIIRDYNSELVAEIAILENLQRENLNILEEAEAYNQLLKINNMTQEDFAKRIGKSRSYVSNTLGLLKLPKKVQKLIINDEISMSHARVLSKIPDSEKVIELSKKIINNNINVREIEALSKEIKNKTISKKKIPRTKLKSAEKTISKVFNSSVKVTDTKIVINYKNNLDEILSIIDKINNGNN